MTFKFLLKREKIEGEQRLSIFKSRLESISNSDRTFLYSNLVCFEIGLRGYQLTCFKFGRDGSPTKFVFNDFFLDKVSKNIHLPLKHTRKNLK